MARPRLQLSLAVVVCISWLLVKVSGSPQCEAALGSPDFRSCELLLFGTRIQGTHIILTDGISRIDQKDHLFHPRAEDIMERPPGVSALQFRWKLPLPQPKYPETWREQNPTLDAPPQTRWGPVPWSNAGCKIMLLPIKQLNGDLTYDTSKFKPLANIGGNIIDICVAPVELGGRGTNSRVILVIFQPGSEFDRSLTTSSDGEVAHLSEDEADEGSLDDGYDEPPGPKRIKTGSGSAAASSSIQVGTLYSTTQAISANIGSGWLMRYDAVKSILPVLEAAKQLVAFYGFVADEASAQIRSGATELKKLAFTLGSISMSLRATDVIHWDWIVEFAMSMEDATNLGNPIQYASTVTSSWQQNTIKAELLFEGEGAG
ncbi:MAG: hypothetical protein Q9208_001427 [Pyrenodesmia sp. 3 TL-2023]